MRMYWTHVFAQVFFFVNDAHAGVCASCLLWRNVCCFCATKFNHHEFSLFSFFSVPYPRALLQGEMAHWCCCTMAGHTAKNKKVHLNLLSRLVSLVFKLYSLEWKCEISLTLSELSTSWRMSSAEQRWSHFIWETSWSCFVPETNETNIQLSAGSLLFSGALACFHGDKTWSFKF